MLSSRFIPESVFYTQSVMSTPLFMPEFMFYAQSVVRSTCFILTVSVLSVVLRVFRYLDNSPQRQLALDDSPPVSGQFAPSLWTIRPKSLDD